jgi:hypothetical protein
MNGSKYFPKIDLKQAYHQLELKEESRYITTFSTHEGLFRYKRLNYGTNSAPELFQNILQQNLSDIRGVKNIADDIIVHGKTRKQHDESLENCLKRLAQLNLKVKPEKCSSLRNEIKVTPYDENIDFVLFYIFIDLYRGARDLSISANIF